MRYAILCFMFVVAGSVAWAIGPYIPADDIVGSEARSDVELVCNSWKCARPCKAILKTATSALGSGGVLNCLMTLFYKESTCNTHGPQKKGTAGNPHAGFGLCTIETSPALREKRGPNCRAASPSNVRAQVLCCRDMVRDTSKSRSYFGPIRRGEVPKCI